LTFGVALSEDDFGLLRRWGHIQASLFPWLREELGPLTSKHQQLVVSLDLLGLEAFVPAAAAAAADRARIGAPSPAPSSPRWCSTCRPRALCSTGCTAIPVCAGCAAGNAAANASEATFSRAFAEFAAEQLPERIHRALIAASHENRLVGHIARDSTEIEAREKPPKPPKPPVQPRAKRGARKKQLRPGKTKGLLRQRSDRLQRQPTMTLAAMLADLPTRCDVGIKRSSKGFRHAWIGYKLHLDAADGDIPVSCLLTSASVHDSQVAIPLMTITTNRVRYLYELMDTAYAAKAIRDHSLALGHQPIIEPSDRHAPGGKQRHADERRRLTALGLDRPEDRHFDHRSAAERVISNHKDNFGGRMIRVRGAAKVFCHLMFGLIALTAAQLLRLLPIPARAT
jgi:Transposase DDE domain